jgi:hypothetical protein
MSETERRISIKAIIALFFYLIIPLFAIYIIITTYPELSQDRFITMVYWFVPLAIILVLISQASIRYPRGHNMKFFLDITYVVFTVLWLFAFLGGGINITQSWGEYEFTLHLWKYIVVIIFVAIFNMVYYTLEWNFYKKELYLLL